MDQPIVSAQSAIVFAVEPVQGRLYKIDDRFTGSFPPHARNFFAGLLFLATPQQHEDHQHARFDNLGVDGQGAMESMFGLFVIFGTAESFENSINVTGAQAVKSQAKLRVQFDGPREVRNRRVAVFRRDRTKDEARKAIAPAQVFLVGFGVDRFGLGQTGLFVRAQFDAQAVDDAFGDLVLHSDDVVSGGIDAIAPDDLAVFDVEQLRGHPEALAYVNE